MTKNRAALLGIAAPLAFALLLLVAAPGAAHHKSSHSKGGKGKHAKSHKGVTEDNDKNDNDTPNNVVDDGDNRHPSGKDKSVENGNSGNQGNSSSDPDDDGRGPDRSNGGADKPDGPGGVDLADQDGNNGCGNDDDFEDDNEGWCGNKPKKDKKVKSKGPKPAPAVKGKKVTKDGTCPDGSTDMAGDCTVPKDTTCPDGTDMTGGCGDIVEGALTCAADAVMVGTECLVISDYVERVQDTKVLGERLVRPESGLPETALAAEDETVAGESAERSRSRLAFTGGGVLKLILIALVLIVVGMVMLRSRRRV